MRCCFPLPVPSTSPLRESMVRCLSAAPSTIKEPSRLITYHYRMYFFPDITYSTTTSKGASASISSTSSSGRGVSTLSMRVADTLGVILRGRICCYMSDQCAGPPGKVSKSSKSIDTSETFKKEVVLIVLACFAQCKGLYFIRLIIH